MRPIQLLIRKSPLTFPAVQFDQLDSVPLAVIRRQARASELSRVVPQCVGWSGTQCVRSKCEPVATSPSIGTAAFAWKLGWSFMDNLPTWARSSVPQRPLAPWHGQRISGLIAILALRTTQFASGLKSTIANSRVQIGRYTATGKANGIRIHRRSEPMSTTY